jgi:hypothetical protein
VIADDKYRHFCCESLENVENYFEAVNSSEVWVCHHRNGEKMSAKELVDKGLYFNRPAAELLFMRLTDHLSLHHKGKTVSTETRRKSSQSHKGQNAWNKGKTLTEEHKANMRKPKNRSESLKEENRLRCKGKTWKLINGKRVWLTNSNL